MAPRKLPGLVGFFDPRGRLDRDRVLARADVALPGAASLSYVDQWFAVAVTPGGHLDVNGDRILALDGRIENAPALRQGLELDERSSFRDTLRRAGARSPETFVEDLRGSFVLAQWDRSRRRGSLFADHLGIRSLFYVARHDGSLAFASEIVVLLDLLDSRPSPSAEGIAGYLLDHTAPPGTTLYDGMSRLGAARALELDSGWRERRYWLPRHRPLLRATREELAEALWERIVRTVDAKLDRDDRPAVILSGGLDSSTVAAAAVAAAAARGKPLPRTYSAVFPDMPEIDESERVDAVVGFLDVDSVQLSLAPSGSFALALEYVAAWSQPLQGPGAALEQPLIERAAAEGCTAILDGQSGDEIFDHSPYIIGDRLRRGRLVSSFRLAATVVPGHITGVRRWRLALRPLKLFGVQPAIPAALHERLRRMKARRRDLPSWFAAPEGTYDPYVPTEWAWKSNPGPRWWAHQLYASAQMRDQIGASDYLRHRAWAVGAEARPPLIDVDLIEFILRLPPEIGFHTAFPDRPLLRESLKGRVPEIVRLNTVKSNVAAFYYETLAGPDLAPIRRLLMHGRPEITPYVNQHEVERLLGQQPGVGGEGWYRWFASVWRLAAIEVWLRQEADPSFVSRALSAPDVTPTIRADRRVRRRAESSFFPTYDPGGAV